MPRKPPNVTNVTSPIKSSRAKAKRNKPVKATSVIDISPISSTTINRSSDGGDTSTINITSKDTNSSPNSGVMFNESSSNSSLEVSSSNGMGKLDSGRPPTLRDSNEIDTNSKNNSSKTPIHPFSPEEYRLQVLERVGFTEDIVREAVESTRKDLQDDVGMVRRRASETVFELANLKPRPSNSGSGQGEVKVVVNIANWIKDATE